MKEIVSRICEVAQTADRTGGMTMEQTAIELSITVTSVRRCIGMLVREGYPIEMPNVAPRTKRPVQKGCSIRLKMFQQISEQPSFRNAS